MKIQHGFNISRKLSALLAICFSMGYVQNAWSVPIVKADAEEATIITRKASYDPSILVGDLEDSGVVFENYLEGNADIPILDNQHFRRGKNSIFFELKPQTQASIITSYNKTRSEIQFEGSNTPAPGIVTKTQRIPFNATRYTGFSLKIPQNFQETNPLNSTSYLSEHIIMQWYQYSPAPPPLYLLLNKKPDGLTLSVINSRKTGPGDDSYNDFTYEEIGTVNLENLKGEWLDFKISYRLSTATSGSFVMWMKKELEQTYSTQVANRKNLQIGFSAQEGASSGLQHKFGFYRPGPVNKTHTLWFDEVRNGTSLNDVLADNYNDAEYLISNRSSVLCLNVNQSSITAETCENGIANKWFIPGKPGAQSYSIKNVSLNLCLEAPNSSSVKLLLKSCDGNKNQLWKLKKIRDEGVLDKPDKGFQFQSKSTGGRCLDLPIISKSTSQMRFRAKPKKSGINAPRTFKSTQKRKHGKQNSVSPKNTTVVEIPVLNTCSVNAASQIWQF